MKVSVSAKAGGTFEGVTEGGFSIITAVAPPEGRPQRGPRPMELLLVALGSCTAMDVAGILRKMRQPFAGLTVDVTADQATEHPKVFTRIELRYTVRGQDLDPAQVARAIQLSQERYCSVAAMLRPAVRLAYTWEIAEPVAAQERLTA